MKIHEYQAKEIFRRFGVPTPRGEMVTTLEQARAELTAMHSTMVKDHPQVLAGSCGRYFAWEVPDPERWVPHGYAVVHIDARGTGRSPGVWSPFSTREGVDFAEAIEWLAGLPWCNGRVGVADTRLIPPSTVVPESLLGLLGLALVIPVVTNRRRLASLLGSVR